jgi:sporulation protein YlmC with PRC-barrel domain
MAIALFFSRGNSMKGQNVWLASALLGSRVRNAVGEDLGKVEEFVLDPATGQIDYAVLSFGGFLGMGDKLFAIPWNALGVSPARDYILLNVDRGRLENAPGFDRNHWPDMTDPTWRRALDDYYGSTRPTARTVYVDRPVRERRRGVPVLAALLLIPILLGLLWTAYLVSTQGWDQTRNDLGSYFQGAAYAMKETSSDVTLTAKVKTALSLSKRIPASQINVDSMGDMVTLRGEVPSDQVKMLAEEIARDTRGVREVQNHLYVMAPQQ